MQCKIEGRVRDKLNNNKKMIFLRIQKDSKDTITRIEAASDKNQKDNTKRLQSRARDVDKWKETLQRAIHAMSEEVSTMEEQRRRLKQSLSVLRVPEAIGKEVNFFFILNFF